MIFERKILKVVIGWTDKPEIVVVTGMRQVGKTTLLRTVFDSVESGNKVFLDVENPIIQKAFEEKDYENIMPNLSAFGVNTKEKAYIFLDEVQSMPSIIMPIKYLHDHYNIKFFLTGSSSFYLKNLFPESLAGRKIIFELFPLDFEEFLVFKQAKKEFPLDFSEKSEKKNIVSFEKHGKLFEEFLQWGGFPKVVLSGTPEEKNACLDDIFTSYFEKEVKGLGDFKDNSVLRDFILMLMQRAGSKLNITKIASEQGISRETAYKFLSFLEATYFISLVSPFSRNVGAEVSGAKKLYLCDTGILNKFAKVSSGAVFENAVFNTLKKLEEIKYYQRRSGIEIDFILEKEMIGFEAKEKASDYDKKAMSHSAEKIGLKKWFVVSKNFVQKNGFICAQDL